MNRAVVPLILLLAVTAGVGVWLWNNGDGGDELRLGGYIEAEQIQVGSKLAGRVKEVGRVLRENAGNPQEIAVDEGAEVEAGQVLVVFETDDVEAQLREAEADCEKARARLSELKDVGTREEVKDQARAQVRRLEQKAKMMRDGPRQEDVNQAEQRYERTKVESENARSNYDRIVALFERKAAAMESLDAARKVMEMANRATEADRLEFEKLKKGFREEEKAMAEHELEEAKASLRLAENGPLQQEKDQAQASVDAAEARIRRLNVLFEEATVKAPLPSVIEAFELQPGDMVAPGAPLATLVRKDQLWVRTFVPETDLGLIRDNQKVQVTVDSFPGHRFEGTILRVNRIAEFTPRNVQTYKERQDMLFGIKVRITDKRVTEPESEFKDALRPGMAATVYVAKYSSGLR